MTARRPLPPHLRDRGFRVGEGLEAGLSSGRMRRADLRAPTHGARIPPTHTFRDAVLAVMSPDQAFTGPTAAAIWGIPLPRRWEGDGRVWVSTRSRDRSMRRDRVVPSRRSTGAVVMHRGLPVLDPARTWSSLWQLLQPHDLTAAADRIVADAPRRPALASLDELRDEVVRVRRGRRRLAAALAETRVGAWSRPESLLRIALLRAGLPEPVLNGAVAVPGGEAVPDLAWPEFLVCAEYDGEWHDDPRQRAADLERHERLVDAGWLVTHVRSRELFPEPLVAVAQVLRRLTSRGYRHPTATIERARTIGWVP